MPLPKAVEFLGVRAASPALRLTHLLAGRFVLTLVTAAGGLLLMTSFVEVAAAELVVPEGLVELLFPHPAPTSTTAPKDISVR